MSRRLQSAGPLILLLTLCGVFSAPVNAQEAGKDEREFVSALPSHVPLKVTVKNLEKVKDLRNEKWYGELEVEVKNIGTRPIYRFGLLLRLPEVKHDGTIYAHQFHYGRGELIDLSVKALPSDTPLLPGESSTFMVEERFVKGWEGYSAERNIPPPKKVEFVLLSMSFGDGTGLVGSDGVFLPRRKN